MPKKLVVDLPDRINAQLVARMKRQERKTITAQILNYIKLGEFIYEALDRGETICVRRKDGSVHDTLFIDP